MLLYVGRGWLLLGSRSVAGSQSEVQQGLIEHGHAASGSMRRDRGGRRIRLRLAATWPWAGQRTTAITRLQAHAPS